MNENSRSGDGFREIRDGIQSDLESLQLTPFDERYLRALGEICAIASQVMDTREWPGYTVEMLGNASAGVGRVAISTANKAKGIVTIPLPGPPDVRL